MWIIAVLLCILTALFIFLRTYPPFGGRSDPKQWFGSPNFHVNVFVNQIPTSMKITLSDMLSLAREQIKSSKQRKPVKPIQPERVNMALFLQAKTPQLMWLGHSTVLLNIHGKIILTDPILSKRSSPFQFIGPKRDISQLPITADELPPIDVVIISHDHYDHLDYSTIQKISGKTKKFMVPLGVASHLRKWGIQDMQIEELDWWESVEFAGLRLTCSPSRHFSGRSINDRFKTLWCSWVIEADELKVFFSGDTGYGPHFKEIGDIYGPFDLTLMECGQYDKRWANIHMLPEDTVQAHIDLNGRRLFPIHWGAFALALHPWNESVQRADAYSIKSKVQFISARLGEIHPITSTDVSATRWWDESYVS